MEGGELEPVTEPVTEPSSLNENVGEAGNADHVAAGQELEEGQHHEETTEEISGRHHEDISTSISEDKLTENGSLGDSHVTGHTELNGAHSQLAEGEIPMESENETAPRGDQQGATDRSSEQTQDPASEKTGEEKDVFGRDRDRDRDRERERDRDGDRFSDRRDRNDRSDRDSRFSRGGGGGGRDRDRNRSPERAGRGGGADRRRSYDENSPVHNYLLVGNLTPEVTEDVLREEFSKFGTVSYIWRDTQYSYGRSA